MNHYTYVSSDENGNATYTTMSEKEILDHYYSFWKEKMIEKYGEEKFNDDWSKKDCIDDWVVVHWAWESE